MFQIANAFFLTELIFARDLDRAELRSKKRNNREKDHTIYFQLNCILNCLLRVKA